MFESRRFDSRLQIQFFMGLRIILRTDAFLKVIKDNVFAFYQVIVGFPGSLEVDKYS